MLTVKDYGKTLEEAGFIDVAAVDNTEYFLKILNGELKKFRAQEKVVAFRYSQESFDKICKGWEAKVNRCKAGDQVWGYFLAKKSFQL